MKNRNDVRRFWSRVLVGDGCWLWKGNLWSTGYGRFNGEGKSVGAHRWAYEHLIGQIPLNHELHHECEVKHCVNPSHLTPVTRATHPGNGADIYRRKTHCPQGHPYDLTNTIIGLNGSRTCRTCAKAAQARSYEKRKQLKSINATQEVAA